MWMSLHPKLTLSPTQKDMIKGYRRCRRITHDHDMSDMEIDNLPY
jgi:hypothetical protein